LTNKVVYKAGSASYCCRAA